MFVVVDFIALIAAIVLLLCIVAYFLGEYTDWGLLVRVRLLNIFRPIWRLTSRRK